MKSFVMVALGACLWGCWSLFLRPAGLTGPQSAFLSLALMSLPAPFVFQRAAFRDRRATVAMGVLALSDAANAALFFASFFSIFFHSSESVFSALAICSRLSPTSSVRQSSSR